MINVMFVCLGNICRSPLAEAVFAQQVLAQGLEKQIYVESCGTAAYHIGENPDPRTIKVAKKHSIPVNHKAQQLITQHFVSFDYLVVMDESNAQNAKELRPTNASAQILILRDFDVLNKGADVIDPWFGNEDGFEECYQVVKRSCEEFLYFLVNKHNLGVV